MKLPPFVLLVLLWCFSGAAQAADSGANSSEKDPWEGFNRAMFAFNDTLDTYVLRPTAVGYRAVTPKPVRQGVDNVFANVLEVSNIFNDLLQGKAASAGRDTGRLLINTTLGVAGIFDVAKHMGLARSDGEDFGQTLGVWGVPDGPYLVLPVFGPRTLRDAAATPMDWVSDPKTYIGDTDTSYGIKALGIVSRRAQLIDVEQDIGSDKYILYRDIYLQHRNYLLKDGKVKDTFGSGDDFGDF